MSHFIWITHPFGGRSVLDGTIEDDILKWVEEQYSLGFRLCGMNHGPRWLFERMEFDDGR